MAMDSIGWNEPVTVVPEGAQPGDGQAFDTTGWDATQGDREFERQGRDAYGDDWMNAIRAQERQRKWDEDNAIAQRSERVFEDLNNIALRDQQQKIQERQMDDATLSALMRQAQTNNGFVPASVLEAASQNLGVPLAGANFGEDGMFYLWGRDGKTGRMVPIGGATPEMQYGVYERSRTGLAQRQKIFDNLSRRFTPEQLSKIGIKDTRGAVEVSPGVRDKGGMFSQMMDPWKGRHSSIGAFSADGKGGFTRYYSGEETGHQLVSQDSGTRASNGAEQWKQISVGADPNSDDGTQVRRYENSRTGEVVSVRDGETPPWESRGYGDRERIARINAASREKQAQIQAQGRADSAQISAELKRLGYDIDAAKLEELRRHNQETEKNAAARGAGRAAGSEAKYDDKYAERLKGDWQDLVDKYGEEPTPEQQKEIAAAKAKYNRYIDGFGGGEESASPAQGGESEAERLRRENERLMALKQSRQQAAANPGGGAQRGGAVQTPAQAEPANGKPSASQPTTPPQNAVRRPSGADIMTERATSAKKKRRNGTPPRRMGNPSHSLEEEKEARFNQWWIEHGGRGMTKEEGRRQFEAEEEEREKRNAVLGTGPKSNGRRGLVAGSINID